MGPQVADLTEKIADLLTAGITAGAMIAAAGIAATLRKPRAHKASEAIGRRDEPGSGTIATSRGKPCAASA